MSPPTLDRCAAAFAEVRETYVIVQGRDGYEIRIDGGDLTCFFFGSRAECQAWIDEQAARACNAAQWQPIGIVDIWRLPHDEKRVILHIPAEPYGLPEFVGIFAWRERECARGDDHGRAWFDDAGRELKRRPTHWMPLPQPPRTTGDAE